MVGERVPSQLAQMFANDSTIGEYVGARSESVIGALAPVTIGEKLEPTGWTIVVEQPSATAFGTIWTSAILLSLLVLLAGTLALLWAWQQAKRLLQPLTGLRTGAAMLGAGHLEYRIERISDDEFGDVSVAFNTMAGHLQESLDEIAQQNDRLRRGLALARDIQIGLLPDRPPWNQDAMSVYARSLPAYEVGGDFYTYLALNEGRTAIAIGDISGKGVGAALLMALTASAVESQGRQLEHPAQVLVALNQLLAPRLQANHMNAALQFVVFDPATATLRVANAGMIAPVLINKSGSRFIDVGGLPLGAFSGAKYQEAEVTLEPGDTLLLVSDGVVEAHNVQGELFGFEQLEHLLAEQPANDLSMLVEMVLARVQDHIGKAEQHDDITIVAVRPQIRSDIARTHEEQAIDYAVV
ncbi:MAG TPA: SpoIIE family protein phosphatase, partial [Roseiflexaceae bacterium]|nr:SpoIIE family protein phosphatase [Roseiflexaceae bacterium]